jgi:hypothetical protein
MFGVDRCEEQFIHMTTNMCVVSLESKQNVCNDVLI